MRGRAGLCLHVASDMSEHVARGDLRIVGLHCLRCGQHYPVAHHARDCDLCRDTAPSGLTATYGDDILTPRPPHLRGSGMWRYSALLPLDAASALSLDEGGTPLRPLLRIGNALGFSRLEVKDETRNPTASFKDRLASVGVSAARALGARVIVSSSSGNAGAATAAYAALGGMPCVVFATPDAPQCMVAQMRALGALVLIAARSEDRLPILQEGVRRFGWFPVSPFTLPATGSNPIAIEGYKTIAYEIAEACDWNVPDWFVLPVCYGDALAAVERGFEDMVALGWTRRVPRLVAAEVSGSLGAALASGRDVLPRLLPNRPTVALSIAATQGTFQALDALRRSDGLAVTVSDDAMMRWQETLAHSEGLWVEASSAAAFAALEQLTEIGTIRRSDHVVVLATASGLKSTPDLRGTALAGPDFDDAIAAIRQGYGAAVTLQ